MSMPAARLEPTIPPSDRLQTHAFELAAMGSAHIFMLTVSLAFAEYIPIYEGVWGNRDIVP
jgi:hypothetical protein